MKRTTVILLGLLFTIVTIGITQAQPVCYPILVCPDATISCEAPDPIKNSQATLFLQSEYPERAGFQTIRYMDTNTWRGHSGEFHTRYTGPIEWGNGTGLRYMISSEQTGQMITVARQYGMWIDNKGEIHWQVNTGGGGYDNWEPAGLQYTRMALKVSGLYLENHGDTLLVLTADKDNNGSREDLNPEIRFIQDGGSHNLSVGLEGDAGSKFTGSIANAGYIAATNPSHPLQLAAGGQARLTLMPTKPVIYGSREGNAALTSLLWELEQMGLIQDNTTP